MRAEKDAGRLVHALREGRVVKNTAAGRLAELLRLGPLGQIVACTALLVAAA